MRATSKVRAITATQHAEVMNDYMKEGVRQANSLGNRGPIRYDSEGNLHRDILDSYWEHGFYVFEKVILDRELKELRADMERVRKEAEAPGSDIDADKNGEAGTLHIGFNLPLLLYAFVFNLR